jgi:Tol biopolymer transport system component
MRFPSRIAPVVSLVSAVAMLACGPGKLPEAPTTVIALSTPTWFEEIGAHFEVSPTGRQAVYNGDDRGRVIDLSTLRVDTGLWSGGLPQVRATTFDYRGALVRQATLNGQPGVFVDEPGGPKPAPLPAGVVPGWSSDGSAIAYFAPGDSSISVGPTGHARTVPLGGGVSGLAWSAKGDAVYTLILDRRDGLSSLLRVDAATGAVDTVKQHLDASPAPNNPAPSDDGRSIYLALASDSVPNPKARHDPQAHRDLDIYQLDLKSGQLRAVSPEPKDDCCPVIAAGYLYWTRNAVTTDVVVLPVSGGEPRVIAQDGFFPRFSRDGRRVAYTRGNLRLADYGLDMDEWVVDFDSTASAPSTPRVFVAGTGEDMGAVWSPDSRWVTFHSHRGPIPYPLYDSKERSDDIWLRLAQPESSPEIRLTDFGWETGLPDWSPDGRRIVFDTWDRGGAPGVSKPWIVTIDPAAGRVVNAKRLVLPPGVEGVVSPEAWAPVRPEIAFVQRIDAARHALWVMNTDGTGARKLVEFPCVTYCGLSWTPDGKELFYGALAGETMQIFAIPRAGGVPRQITHGSSSILQPQISYDGRWIAATRIVWEKELRRAKL